MFGSNGIEKHPKDAKGPRKDATPKEAMAEKNNNSLKYKSVKIVLVTPALLRWSVLSNNQILHQIPH